ncbi:MAG: N-6 DNA methylase [bacterium]|nr:N-6 DNA methylase [bacterium]
MRCQPARFFASVTISNCFEKKSQTVLCVIAVNSTLFIDASKECVKVTNNNKLTEENIAKIVTAFTERTDTDYFCRLVPNKEIAENDYNLSVSTYVEQEDTREVIDIAVLNAKIAEIVKRENVLRNEIDRIIAEIEG